MKMFPLGKTHNNASNSHFGTLVLFFGLQRHRVLHRANEKISISAVVVIQKLRTVLILRIAVTTHNNVVDRPAALQWMIACAVTSRGG